MKCRVLDFSGRGAKLHADPDLPDGSSAVLHLEAARPREGQVAWRDGDFLGLCFTQDRLTRDVLVASPDHDGGTKPEERRPWWRSEAVRFLEILLTIVGVWIIAYQAMLTADESKIQTALQVVDSERFVNKLLIENKELQPHLSMSETGGRRLLRLLEPKRPGDLDRSLLGFVFLNEFEKMYWLRKKGVIEDVFWCAFEPLIWRQLSVPAVREVLFSSGRTLDGFDPDFVDFAKGLSKRGPQDTACSPSDNTESAFIGQALDVPH